MGRAKEKELVKRYARSTVYMLTGGLEHRVAGVGGVCLGISLRGVEGDCLIVVRADFEGKKMVAFTGGVTMAGALVRLEKGLRKNEVRWQPDKFAEQE
jgi:hypothetical protein